MKGCSSKGIQGIIAVPAKFDGMNLKDEFD